MKKILLKDESVYTDLVNHVVIDRALLKDRILFSAYIAQDRVNPRPFRPGYHHFKIEGSQPYSWLIDYVRQHYQVEFNNPFLKMHDLYGSLLLPREQSLKRNHKKEKNPPDYIMIYGVDVDKDSSVIIETRDKRGIEELSLFKIKNNHFLLFPAYLRFFINENTSFHTNVFLTTTYITV